MPDDAITSFVSPNFEKLKAKLRELFELDKADLDFGNGPHTLYDPHNRVYIIEEAFQRLMFDSTNFESLSQTLQRL
jgi:hypothetical protein